MAIEYVRIHADQGSNYAADSGAEMERLHQPRHQIPTYMFTRQRVQKGFQLSVRISLASSSDRRATYTFGVGGILGRDTTVNGLAECHQIMYNGLPTATCGETSARKRSCEKRGWWVLETEASSAVSMQTNFQTNSICKVRIAELWTSHARNGL